MNKTRYAIIKSLQYNLRNKDTDEQHEEFCTWTELQDLLSKNPKYEQMPTAAALVGDHLMGVGPKIDNGFKDNLTDGGACLLTSP